MSAAALIGDQLILEEYYDENYTPTEQGTPCLEIDFGMAAGHCIVYYVWRSSIIVCQQL